MEAPKIVRDEKAHLDRLERRLLLEVGKCTKEFGLIEHGDRVMVGISGGKDSYTLLHLLRRMQRRVPFDFEIVAMTLDQGQPGFTGHVIEEFMAREGFEFHMIHQDTYSVVVEKVPEGKAYCSLCSRMRRGILYRVADELGATKIALGHHRDDLIETLLLNVLYAGTLKAMPPRLTADDGRHVVIRPMAYCAEEEIAEFAAAKGFPIIPCNLCGSQDNLHRQKVKRLIADLSAQNPKVKGNLLASLSNVVPGHLLDRALLADLGRPVPAQRMGEDAAEANEPPEADDTSAESATPSAARLPILGVGTPQ
jgi:tRNA 2-thiocytidine biosynthesis protein TtcA